MSTARHAAHAHITRRIARQVGDLHEQIRVATTGLPLVEAAPTIRVHHGEGITLDVCELWGLVGPSWLPRRLCGLPAGIGLRMDLVEKAAESCGFAFPLADLGRRARWRRIQPPGSPTAWFDLALLVPGYEDGSSSREAADAR